MQRLRLTSLIAILTVILAVGALSPAYASCVRSISYTVFNSSTFTYYALDKNYTSGFAATVVNKLTYNTTTNKAAIVRFHLDEDTASGAYIELSFWATKELHVWHNDGSTSVEIGAGYWESGNNTKLTVTKDGVISVVDYDGNYVVKNYGIGAVTLYWVGGHGESTASIATSGYVTVSVGTVEGSDVTSAVTPWIPVIVTFAMLGVALGFIKKFGS